MRRLLEDSVCTTNEQNYLIFCKRKMYFRVKIDCFKRKIKQQREKWNMIQKKRERGWCTPDEIFINFCDCQGWNLRQMGPVRLIFNCPSKIKKKNIIELRQNKDNF